MRQTTQSNRLEQLVFPLRMMPAAPVTTPDAPTTPTTPTPTKPLPAPVEPRPVERPEEQPSHCPDPSTCPVR